MSEFEFKTAERKSAPVTIAIAGKSGSGKTYSALKMARGLVGDSGKIAVIDTEGNRACMYANNPEIGDYAHVDMRPPYSSARFYEAVKSAVESGFQAIIIDSASHEHEGEGGMLSYADQVREEMINSAEQKARKFGKSFNRDWYDPGFAVWNKPKTAHNRFIRYAVSCPAHIIFCLRMKTVNEMVDNGKKKIMQETDKMVCESQLIYDMTLALYLGSEGRDKHRATYIKVPEPYQAHIRNGEMITVDHGRLLLNESSAGAKDDPELSLWVSACEQEAAKGIAAIKAHFNTLSEEQKEALKPYKAGFNDIAVAADAKSAADAAYEEYVQHDTQE